jgi:hypothetical protein
MHLVIDWCGQHNTSPNEQRFAKTFYNGTIDRDVGIIDCFSNRTKKKKFLFFVSAFKLPLKRKSTIFKTEL